MKDSFRVFLVIQFIQVPLAILIAWFIQDILHFQFSPITIGICVWLIFTAFVFVLLESPQYQASTNQKKNLRRVVVILSVGLVTLPIILQIRDRLVRPPTVYYVL